MENSTTYNNAYESLTLQCTNQVLVEQNAHSGRPIPLVLRLVSSNTIVPPRTTTLCVHPGALLSFHRPLLVVLLPLYEIQ